MAEGADTIRFNEMLESGGFRGGDMPPERLAAAVRGLRGLHALELFAAAKYRFMIPHGCPEHALPLITAARSEAHHCADCMAALYEYGGRPGYFRFMSWLAGAVTGWFARIRGVTAVTNAAARLEGRMIHRYYTLLSTVQWDSATRAMLERNQADEYAHSYLWRDTNE